MHHAFHTILVLILALVLSACNNTKTVTTHGTVDKNLTIKSNATTVNVAGHIELSVVGTYSDGSSNAVDENITYTITPNDSAEVNGSVLIAKKDGNVTVQATVGGVKSNSINLSITWIVNGHVLPPEPDPIVNDSTLLGIDVNDNGVRDDVERWIYESYDHPIERGIFMQSSRAYNKVIVDPKKAHETVKYINNSSSCNYYFEDNNEYIGKKYEYSHMDEELEKIQFNTLKRHMAYKRYNAEFNGEVFDSPEASKEKCEFDENGILGEVK